MTDKDEKVKEELTSDSISEKPVLSKVKNAGVYYEIEPLSLPLLLKLAAVTDAEGKALYDLQEGQVVKIVCIDRRGVGIEFEKDGKTIRGIVSKDCIDLKAIFNQQNHPKQKQE